MATTLPNNATKANSDNVLDDPAQSLLVDLAGVVDMANALKAALGAGAQLNITEGLGTDAQGGGTPDDLRVEMPVSGKTGAYEITTTDRAKLIRTTGAGGFTLSFTAVVTLGDGWYCAVRNDCTGTVTLDPNSAETIDGVATKTLDPGQSAIIWCNGSLLVTLGPWNINALESITAGSPTTEVDADNDELLIYDNSDGRHKKVNPSALGSGGFNPFATRQPTSDATIDFETLDADVDGFLFEFNGLTIDTDARQVGVRVGTGGGPTYQTTNYSFAAQRINASAGSNSHLATSQAGIFLMEAAAQSLGNLSGESLSGWIRLHNPHSGSTFTQITWHISYQRETDGVLSSVYGGGSWDTATAVTAVQLYLTGSGNFDGGRVTGYEMKNS